MKGGPPYQPGVADLVYKRIFQAADRGIVLTERNMQYRQIFTDGRPLPDDQQPTWNGYSTARWEGDTPAHMKK